MTEESEWFTGPGAVDHSEQYCGPKRNHQNRVQHPSPISVRAGTFSEGVAVRPQCHYLRCQPLLGVPQRSRYDLVFSFINIILPLDRSAGATKVSPCVAAGPLIEIGFVISSDGLDSLSNDSEQCNRKGKHWLRVLVATSHSHWKKGKSRARVSRSKQVGLYARARHT